MERIRREARDTAELGRWFSNLVRVVLVDLPEYELVEVHHWAEWPEREALTGRPPDDWGIDLVGRRMDGSFVAIQCKCYKPSRKVGKTDTNSFLANSQLPVFTKRWIVTTSDWTRPAAREIDGMHPPVGRINFLQHWDYPVPDEATERPTQALLPRQVEAFDKVVAGFAHHDRGRLVMACGTGKTFTSLRIAEEMVPDGGRILFLAPSISLVSQARRDWLNHTRRRLSSLVVCSDRTAGGRKEGDMRVSHLACDVTTSPESVAARLDTDDTSVIFSTYHSLPVITAAQREHGTSRFDLVVCDEAHRTAGAFKNDPRIFQMVHYEEHLKAAKRLYMTATPRVYTPASRSSLAARNISVVDMTDHGIYGPQFDRLTFREAVELDMLSDYRVIVLRVREAALWPSIRAALVSLADDSTLKSGSRPLTVTTEDLQRVLGASLAVNGMAEGVGPDVPDRLNRSIAFANSIARSKFYAKALDHPLLKRFVTRRRRQQRAGADAALKTEVQHLDASHSSYQRFQALDQLRTAGADDAARILMNVKLFTEGVDVPSLDAVVFMEPRKSHIDIVQAVGRVMRKAEGKHLGYIIVPVAASSQEPLEGGLAVHHSEYRVVGQVLAALQSHDEQLMESVAQYVTMLDVDRKGTSPNGEATDVTDEDWITETLPITIEEVGDVLRPVVIAASGLGRPGKLVTDLIASAVRAAASVLDEARRDAVTGDFIPELSNALGVPIDDTKSLDTCKMAALLIGNACLLHKRLRTVEQWRDLLPDMSTVAVSSDPLDALRTAWETILDKDYEPVFDPALAVLECLPGSQASVQHSIRMLAECADNTADTLSELGYDHAGPLYHNLMPDSQARGAYYTNNLSALMLARLAIGPDFADWHNLDSISGLRIMDPACGTGTLLMASLKTIKDRIAEAGNTAASGEALHKTLVERVLYGLDINQVGVQLAASNFTLGAPTVDYQRMNLYTMKHGPQPDGTVKAGTLEMLTYADPHSLQSLVQPTGPRPGVDGDHVGGGDSTFPHKDLDLVIINPPYTPKHVRNQQFTDEVKDAMQDHELRIRDAVVATNASLRDVVDPNSISTFFTPVVERLVRDDQSSPPEKADLERHSTDPRSKIGTPNPTLAKVLPAAACLNADGVSERRFLAGAFHIERIITSHDPRRVNFSENTNVHECLLIARRANQPHKPTEFVSLRTMPSTPEEAIAAADQISAGEPSSWGSRTLWPADRVQDGDWAPVQWYNFDMGRAARRLGQHSALEAVGQRHFVGPTGENIESTTRRVSEDIPPDARRCFQSIAVRNHQTMGATPDAWVAAKPGKQNTFDYYWNQKSHVLVAKRYSTTSSLLLALWSDTPSIGRGNGWMPVGVNDEAMGKGLVAWWNSTPAAMILLNCRSKKLTYPKWSVGQIRSIGIPKPDNPAWSALTSAYEEAKNTPMLPLKQGTACDARLIIDQAAALALGIDDEQVAEWRHMLTEEPTISNRPAN